MRGIAVSIGDPLQELSFSINGALNDTWVWQSGITLYLGDSRGTVCDNQIAPDQCVTIRGGQYDLDASTSALKLPSNLGLLNDIDSSVLHSAVDGTPVKDEFRFGASALDSYTFGVVKNGFGDRHVVQNSLGLGSNSTLLYALKSAGHIPSRSYAYFNGYSRRFTASPSVSGQIIFGGYDSARNSGLNISHPIVAPTSDCPTGMWLDIEDVALTFANGTSSSISAGAIQRACVRPQDQMIMSLAREPYWQRFAAYTNTLSQGAQPSVINNLGLLYSADAVYDGGLRIDLGFGVAVNFTNEMLVTAAQSVNTDGAMITNSSTAEVMVHAFSPADKIPALGRQFFAAAQLFVDHEASTFTIAPVVETEDSNLVAVGVDCAVKRCGSATSNDSTRSSSSLSGGEITGATLGAIAIAALVAAVAFLSVRRRKRSSTATDTAEVVHQEVVYSELDSKLARQELDSRFAEKDVGRQERAELGTGALWHHELEGSNG